jgi:hypothetical protein
MPRLTDANYFTSAFSAYPNGNPRTRHMVWHIRGHTNSAKSAEYSSELNDYSVCRQGASKIIMAPKCLQTMVLSPANRSEGFDSAVSAIRDVDGQT